VGRQGDRQRGVRDPLVVSLKAALGATAVALLLGSLAALAVARYRFFGREAISFLVILPLALPWILSGMALNATFRLWESDYRKVCQASAPRSADASSSEAAVRRSLATTLL
jgi:ABC-type spermidine/putrescine transport system permease subunit II